MNVAINPISKNQQTQTLTGKNNKSNTRNKFSAAAEQYSELAKVQKRAAEDLFALIDHQPNDNTKCCLDLGSGPLVNTAKLAHQYAQVIALDLSFTMLRQASFNVPRVCADMDQLPLQANSIDVIFSNFSLQWSSNFAALMKSLYFSLKANGRAYISVLVKGSLEEIQHAFAAVDSHNHVNNFHTEQYIYQAVQHAGFLIVDAKKQLYCDYYSSPILALRSIKSIGASNHTHSKAQQGLMTRTKLNTVCKCYPMNNNSAEVSYHVVLLSLAK